MCGQGARKGASRSKRFLLREQDQNCFCRAIAGALTLIWRETETASGGKAERPFLRHHCAQPYAMPCRWSTLLIGPNASRLAEIPLIGGIEVTCSVSRAAVLKLRLILAITTFGRGRRRGHSRHWWGARGGHGQHCARGRCYDARGGGGLVAATGGRHRIDLEQRQQYADENHYFTHNRPPTGPRPSERLIPQKRSYCDINLRAGSREPTDSVRPCRS